MNKKSTIVIFVLVLVYLAGILYLSAKDRVKTPDTVSTSGEIIAPDGTQLKGPAGPPGLAPSPVPIEQGDPTKQSNGPTYPPPR